MTAANDIGASVKGVLTWLFDSPEADGLNLPADVEQAARLLFLDSLGCAIGGAAKPELQALNRALSTLESGSIQVPGMEEPLTAPAAAYWSAMAATWDEACEGLARAHGRPGLHAFPVAMALALAGNRSLGTTLQALVRGYELGGRLGQRLRIRPGMHVDGTWGTFGAVAAAGSVLDHDSSTVMAAVEAAACQTPVSLYLPVAQGATVRNTYVAEAARRAISLSQSVAAGVTAPSGALDEFEKLALDGSDAAVAPPGEWFITQGYLKPYAAVRHVHYGAEAALRWKSYQRPTATIKAIALDVYPEAITYCGNRSPQTSIEAQFSLTYGVAHMLVTGDLGPDAYTADALNDPEVRRLEQLIEVSGVPGPSAAHRYASLRIESGHRDGEDKIVIDQVAGDADRPMAREQVENKFLTYTSWLGNRWPAETVAGAILDGPLDTLLGDAILGAEDNALLAEITVDEGS